MGRSLSWLVVENSDADAIARSLAVKRTGVKAERRNMSLAGRTLPDGCYLVVASGTDHPAFKRKHIAALSNLATVTFSDFEEHVMWSSAERWQGGRNIWSVAHRGEDSTLHLQTTGCLPPEFTQLKAEVFARQEAEGAEADVDHIHDLPIEFARQQTGLHPDDDQFEEPVFEQLDAGWASRWYDMPFMAKLPVWIAVFLLFAYLAGKLVRGVVAWFSA